VDIDNFTRELADLMDKHGVRILGVDISGDTHGITENFVVEDADKKAHIIAHYTSWVSASDLRTG